VILRGEDVVLDWILGNISKISFEWLLWGGLSSIFYSLNTLKITRVSFVVTQGYKRSTRSSSGIWFLCLSVSQWYTGCASGALVTFYVATRHERKMQQDRLTQSCTLYWSFDRRLTDTTNLFHFLQSLSQSLLSMATVYLAFSLSISVCARKLSGNLCVAWCTVPVTVSGRSKTQCFPQLGCSDRRFESHSLCGRISEPVLWFCFAVQAETLWWPGAPYSTCLWTDAWGKKIENWTLLIYRSNR